MIIMILKKEERRVEYEFQLNNERVQNVCLKVIEKILYILLSIIKDKR